MIGNLLRVLTCVVLASMVAGVIVADMKCRLNTDCTTASQRCEILQLDPPCYYCDGMIEGSFCEVNLTSTCTETGNQPCGQRIKGTCNGWGTYGACQGTTVVFPTCSVLKC